jgi:aminopeptidase N
MFRSFFLFTLLFHILTIVSAQQDDTEHYCNKAHQSRVFFQKSVRQSSYTDNYDLKYYRFEWQIDPAIYGISGTVTPYFMVVEEDMQTISFDFSKQLIIDSIVWHGSKISYSQPEEYRLDIFFPRAVKASTLDSLSISYHGIPPSGGFGSFIKGAHNGTPILWTLSEPFGAQDWWPCKNGLDDKIDSIDVIITTPAEYRAASNGILSDEILNFDGTKTWHWKHRYPITPYLVAFAVTDYLAYEDEVQLSDGTKMPMVNYVYPEHVQVARKGTLENVKALQFFDSLFVDYPFKNEKYGHAQFGWGGGMEHQTMSFVVNFDWGLLAHELAHQWFGDYVTCGSWEDIWLNEGFATYLEGLSRERFPQAPNDWYNWKLSKINNVTSNPAGAVKVDNPNNVSRIFSSRLSYNKGAYLLHMLRWKLGDEAFFQGIRDYLYNRAFQYALTPDLQDALEQSSGQNLDDFFRKWYEGQGFPTYNISWASTDNKLIIQVQQTTSHPSVDFFDMPLPFVIKANGLTQQLRLENTVKNQQFVIDTEFKTEAVEFDPTLWLLARHNISYNPGLISSTRNIQTAGFTFTPNPAEQYINIHCDTGFPYTYQLMDAGGKLLKSGSLEQPDTVLDIQDLRSGVFLIQLNDESGNSKVIRGIKL